ncbi:MAG: immune inhibitor A [Ignavibacteriaceae bacterium]|nr:immune inhibitor A [Ignavibacteriaceae bacterium]
MKKIFLFVPLLLMILSSSDLSAQNYKQVKIFINNQEEINLLLKSGIDIENISFEKDNSVILFVSETDLLKLVQTGLSYEIIIDDWFAYYNSLPPLSESEKVQIKNQSKREFNVAGFGFGSMGGFYTYQEIVNNLDSMYVKYPNLITPKFSIGTSIEGRTIWAVKISDNPNVTENEPRVGYDALIHAREPASMSTLLYFMWYLLENYSSDPEATYLVNNREIFCVPVFNPDGYEYNRQTNPNGGGMWRKNRRNNGSCYGVDLNRNFTYKWGYDNIGSSNNPCDETYRGASAGSEPETQAVMNFIIGKNIKTYMNMHSYQDAYLYPWGYINQACPDEPTYIDFCIDMTSYNGFQYGTGGQILGYVSNGSSRDWLYGEQTVKNKIFGYTMEIGNSNDGFWPPQSRIFPIAQNSLKSNMYNTWVAGEYVLLKNPNFSQQYFNPGDFVQLTPLLVNKGLSDASDITVNLSSNSPYLNINASNSGPLSISARTEANVSSPLSFSILSNTPFEETLPLVLAIYSNGSFMSVDTIEIMIGTPIEIFTDTTNVISSLWTVTATPSNPKWEETNSSFYSPPNSYTDSKTGNYVSNATVRMTLTSPIDLSSYQHPRLHFATRFDIESNYDYGQVEISTNNGSTWIPLQGNYTQPGTGTFQPPGEPVYDGTIANWVQEEIDLTGFTTNQVKLRFELKTDNSINKDGWYVDDIKVVVFGFIPVELSSFRSETEGNDVSLFWSTSTETNNKGFEIQRSVVSKNNSTDWNNIGFITGSGTSTEERFYSYDDQNLQPEKYSYRIKQIDFDGSFSYSNTINVEINSATEFSLTQNHPNPFNPITIISWQSPIGTWQSLKIYDLLGREITTLVNDFRPAGKYELEFNAADLPSGIYFYQLQAGDFISTRKMVLMK